ncbi:MAG: low affinity iron permease family protein [Polyangiaceae bacterium]
MAKRPKGFMTKVSQGMERFSLAITNFAGSSTAFCSALGIVVVWALLGPVFGFSDTWQLVINTGTTIVTFLMVFLIQRSQNKETKALELKLNELVAAMQGASNHLIDIENASEEELATLHRHYQKLAKLADKESDITSSHSVEEATSRHRAKTASNGSSRATKSAPSVGAKVSAH